jgi:hypothetical protein
MCRPVPRSRTQSTTHTGFRDIVHRAQTSQSRLHLYVKPDIAPLFEKNTEGMMKAYFLCALFLLTSCHAAEKAAEGMLRNRAEVEVDVHGHRELWASGFSWTNLLCK